MAVMDFLSLLPSLITALGVIVAVMELRATAKKNKEDKLHDKRKDTLDAYNTLQAEVLDKLYTDYTPSQIKEIVNNNRKAEYQHDYHVLGTLIARIEHFCVGINTDIYDWETAYELSHGFLDKTIRYRIAPIIEVKESFFGTDPYDNTKKVFAKMDEEAKRRESKS